MAQPLTDAINALTRYANETTGASDTTLSDAVETLVEGYGQGGGGSVSQDAEGYIVLPVDGGGGGSDLSLYNILDGVSVTAGYITASGTVGEQNPSRLEYTTDEVDVTAYNSTLTIMNAIGHTPTDYQWVAISAYDSNHSFLSRTVVAENVRHQFVSSPYTVGSTTSFVRVSFRSYGQCALYLTDDPYDIMEKIGALLVGGNS